MCFVIDLLQGIIMSTISFFMGFHVDSLDGKIRSDRVMKSNLILESYVFYAFLNHQMCSLP